MHFRVLDNSNGERDKNSSHNYSVAPDSEDFNNLQKIANVNLKNPEDGILLFPQSFENFNDDRICRLSNDGNIETGNTMGFVGCGNTTLTIASRFAQQHDYFLHYMLQKVLAINVVNFSTTTDKDDIQDFLPYLFPMYLQKALAKGLFKQYRYNKYNDANVRGVIDAARHIRINIPFAGKVAYRTREFSYNNPVMHLIRHTIEVLRTKDFGRVILSNNSDIKDCVRKIVECTPAYNQRERRKIIAANRKQVNHPYFTEYRNLQKLCLQILRHEKTSFSGSKDEIYGILFDGAWLWEEYVNTIIGDMFWHPRNKAGDLVQYLFDKSNGDIYPDFISKNQTPRIIADAKYKPIENIHGSDYLQVLAYMFRFDSTHGYYIYPSSESGDAAKPLELLQGVDLVNEQSSHRSNDKKVFVEKYGLPIPQNEKSFNDFRKQMTANEEEFLKIINI